MADLENSLGLQRGASPTFTGLELCTVVQAKDREKPLGVLPALMPASDGGVTVDMRKSLGVMLQASTTFTDPQRPTVMRASDRGVTADLRKSFGALPVASPTFTGPQQPKLMPALDRGVMGALRKSLGALQEA